MITAGDITAPYSALEAWAYDRFIAPAVNRYVERLQSGYLTDLPRGARVLDVGCGGGQNARSLAEARPDVRVTGIDLSARQVLRAQRRAGALADRLTFVEASALAMPFVDDSFDGVFSIGSVKHWSDRARGVAECVRVTRPGGRVVIAEADRGCQLTDARRFVATWGVPRGLRLAALAGFRTWVAGLGVDLDEARALTAAAGLAHPFAERVEGAPFVVFGGEAR